MKYLLIIAIIVNLRALSQTDSITLKLSQSYQIIPVSRGGTGSTTAEGAKANLGITGSESGGAGMIAVNQTHTSGNSLTINMGTNHVYIDPTMAIDTLTITLPNLTPNITHIDSIVITLHFGGTIAGGIQVVGHLIMQTTGGDLLFQTSSPSIIYSGESISFSGKPATQYWNRLNSLNTKGELSLLTKQVMLEPFTFLTFSANISWDVTTGKNKGVLLTGNATLTLANAVNGDHGILKVIQDGTGGRVLTLPGDTAVGEWFANSPNSIKFYRWVMDEDGIKWERPNQFLSSSSLDPDVQSFVKRVSIAGGTLTTPQKTSLNTLITTLKGSMDISSYYMWPFVGGTKESFALEFYGKKTLEFNGTHWAFYENGAECNCILGTYGNTNIVPATDMNINDFHISYYSQTDLPNTAGQSGEVAVGARNGTTSAIILMIENEEVAVGDPGSEQQRISFTNTDSRSLHTLIRTSTTRADYYKRGLTVGNNTVTQNGTLPVVPLYFNAQNNGGTQTAGSGGRSSWLSVGISRSAAQELIFYNAIQTFHTDYNRAL